jgi:hypothetical protein
MIGEGVGDTKAANPSYEKAGREAVTPDDN